LKETRDYDVLQLLLLLQLETYRYSDDNYLLKLNCKAFQAAMADQIALNDAIKTLSRNGMQNSKVFVDWCTNQRIKGHLSDLDLRVITKKALDLADGDNDSVKADLWSKKKDGKGFSDPFELFPRIINRVVCVISTAEESKLNSDFTKVPAAGSRPSNYKVKVGSTNINVSLDNDGELIIGYSYLDEAKVDWRKVVDSKVRDKIYDALHFLSEYGGTYANPPSNLNPQLLHSKGIHQMFTDIANGGTLFHVVMPYSCIVV
jgi:hypothetical protein